MYCLLTYNEISFFIKFEVFLIMSFRTPQTMKSFRTSGTPSNQSSLRMSDLSYSRGGQIGNGTPRDDSSSFFQTIIDRQTDNSEFTAQITTSNAEIDNTRNEIQNLMTKAHAYCSNSGLGYTEYHLPVSIPRYGGSRTPRQTKFPITPVRNGEFFRSTISRQVSIKDVLPE